MEIRNGMKKVAAVLMIFSSMTLVDVQQMILRIF